MPVPESGVDLGLVLRLHGVSVKVEVVAGVEDIVALVGSGLESLLRLLWLNRFDNSLLEHLSTKDILEVSASEYLGRIDRVVLHDSPDGLNVLVEDVRKKFERRVSGRLVKGLDSDVGLVGEGLHHENSFVNHLLSFLISEFLERDELDVGLGVLVVEHSSH